MLINFKHLSDPSADLLSRERAVGDDRGGVELLGQELGHQGPLRAARPQGQRPLLPLRLLCRSPLPGERHYVICYQFKLSI